MGMPSRLRQLLQTERVVVAPVCYDPLTARRLHIPLIIDGDAGFGEPFHMLRAIQEFEWGGVASTHIEDRYFPKRARYYKGVEHIISIEEMVVKIRAAVRARQGKDFLIIARTDAMRTDGFDEGVKHGHVYAEAGADMVMCFPNSVEES
jgi:2-methylisocitrate lyase-like PEP mutase family enzyme